MSLYKLLFVLSALCFETKICFSHFLDAEDKKSGVWASGAATSPVASIRLGCFLQGPEAFSMSV